MRTLENILNEMGPARRAKVETKAKKLIAEQMTLSDLRKARHMTQQRIAKELNISQVVVSRMENQSDLLLSTLRKVVGKLGGELELTVRFQDRAPVVLQGFTDGEKPARRSKARSAPNISCPSRAARP